MEALRIVVCLALIVLAVNCDTHKHQVENAEVTSDKAERLYDGDERLTSKQIAGLITDSSLAKANRTANSTVNSREKRNAEDFEWDLIKRWTNAIVPYTISSGYSRAGSAKMIQDSLMKIQAVTCLSFVERTTEENYIEFVNDAGCWSDVGMTGGRQEISLAQWGCMYDDLIIHETMHALGFWHEHQRPDREEFITIKWENVRSDKRYNFEKVYNWDKMAMGDDYDASSIMQYQKSYFSKNGQPTMELKGNSGFALGGFKMTTKDINEINMMYCGNTKTTTRRPTTTRTTTTTTPKPTTTSTTTTKQTTTTQKPKTTTTTTTTRRPKTTKSTTAESTTTTTESVISGNCIDNHYLCPWITKSHYFCKGGSYKNLCKKKCGHCTVTPEPTTTTTTTTEKKCEDNHYNCRWVTDSLNYFCVNKYYTNLCRKSCGKCTGSKTPTTSTTTPQPTTTTPTTTTSTTTTSTTTSTTPTTTSTTTSTTESTTTKKKTTRQLIIKQVVTTAKPTTVTNEDCKDNYGYCSQVVSNRANYCPNSFYRKNCRKSCQLCVTKTVITTTPKPECKDFGYMCKVVDIDHRLYCDIFSWKNTFCRKKCGNC